MDKKKYIIGAVGIVVLIIIVLFFLFFQNKPSKQETTTVKNEESTIVPTIDSSVIVGLTSSNPGKEVLLKIDAIPEKTNTIEYELSYQTAKQGLQGVIGTISLTDEKSYQKNLTLGTCSSGTCVYHQVIGKIRVTLKFSGEYGEKLFEKDFEL